MFNPGKMSPIGAQVMASRLLNQYGPEIAPAQVQEDHPYLTGEDARIVWDAVVEALKGEPCPA